MALGSPSVVFESCTAAACENSVDDPAAEHFVSTFDPKLIERRAVVSMEVVGGECTAQIETAAIRNAGDSLRVQRDVDEIVGSVAASACESDLIMSPALFGCISRERLFGIPTD